MKQINEKEVYAFLDRLRETGLTNMFGAAPYIELAFSVKRIKAKKLLLAWMKQFSSR